jgi:pimeloyl-ACP methyl ester carboxylesterase
MWRAGKAWVLNRGLRDSYQAIADGDGGPGFFSRVKSGLAIASHSGAARAFIYDLKIGTPDAGAKIALNGDHIIGTKTFTYERRCNPWRQLMEVTLERFPGVSGTSQRVLKLDVGYLARIGVPLFRITRQRNGVSAISELATFLGYFLRLLLGQHIWSFRAPDKDIDPANDVVVFRPPITLQLPGGNTVGAQIINIPIGSKKPDIGGGPVLGEVLITRYPYPGTTKRPVVMLHGYSAGGTTFAHQAVNPNFASHLWISGRDIWVADLRTSPAHHTAGEAWSFDQIGDEDVRKVIETAAAESIDGKVDVIAHCMGTVVFSIAALAGKIDNLVDRAAFTQVGPLVVFSPANVFRAYVVRYLIDFLPDAYEFNPKNPTLADDLLDRVLSTLPYPVEEFDFENPLWPTKRTPWTRTRHRMDALYGRDFNVANMEPEMLRFIDEHFGALSLKTVATTLHFVRYALMTNFEGRNLLVSRKRFREQWKFPTFSVHGAENGLSHVSTVDRMRKILDDAGRVYLTPSIIPGAGHQDALVGTKRHVTFQKIEQFLDANISAQATNGSTNKTAYPPWIGPIITEERPDTSALVVRVGSLPSHRMAEGVVMLRVQLSGNQILRPDNPALPWDLAYIVDHMAVYKSRDLEEEGWDAFEAPLSTLMPGYDPAHPGNALLVLIVYDEPSVLFVPVYGHFLAVSTEKRVFRFDPTGPRRDDTPVESFLFESFEKMASAVLRALLTPPLRPKPKDAAEKGLERLVYRGLTKVKSATLEFKPQPVVVDGSTTAIDFDLPAAQGLLERLLESDRDLLDGVIPYDPPTSPPTGPMVSGTSFSLASCQYPAGFFDGPVALQSYSRIVERLQAGTGVKPRFMLFVGDQVYVDPTAGLYDPASEDDRYRLPYEAWLRQRNVRNVLRRIPSFMALDDHEIDDNWEPLAEPDEQWNQKKKELGVKAFVKYQRGIKANVETFDFDGFHFFMLDTRTERTHRKIGNLENAHLFASDPANPNNTMSRLKNWLSNAPGPKFVTSPLMLLPRHRRAVQRDASLDASNLSALHSDGWDGYPNTLREVLVHIAANKIDHVVFLSGDEHRGCVATIDLCDASGSLITRVHSVHTAAMYAPFPFANSLDEDIVTSETIDIVDGAVTYKCVVNATRPPAGDGVTFLRVSREAGVWKLDCEFAHGTLPPLTL